MNAPSGPSRRGSKRGRRVGRTGARFPSARLQETFTGDEPETVEGEDAVLVDESSEETTPETAAVLGTAADTVDTVDTVDTADDVAPVEEPATPEVLVNGEAGAGPAQAAAHDQDPQGAERAGPVGADAGGATPETAPGEPAGNAQPSDAPAEEERAAPVTPSSATPVEEASPAVVPDSGDAQVESSVESADPEPSDPADAGVANTAQPTAEHPSAAADVAESADAAPADALGTVPDPGVPEADSADSAEATPDPAAPAADPAPSDAAGVAPDGRDDQPAADAAPPGAVFVPPDRDDDLDDAVLDDVRSWVRPYVWTGGRTDTTLDFELETLVSARKNEEVDEEAPMRDEHRRVLDLCDQPRSVSEIAALLQVPLGVAKTLLGVMAEDNMLVVHSNGETSATGPDIALMERVLRGLRNL